MSFSRFRAKALGVSALNLGSKSLAIVKTVVVAAVFGAGTALDAFWVAYSLPMLLPSLLTSVITVAFVPRFMASLEGRTGSAAWAGANTLFTVVLALALLAAVVMYPSAGWLVSRLAPGLDADTHRLAVGLTRWMIPAIPVLVAASLLAAICQARERFTLPALEGIVVNLSVIAAALGLAPRFGAQALVWGVMGGFVLQAGLLAWSNRDLVASSLRPALRWTHPDFLGPVSHVVPLLVGSAGAVTAGLVSQYFLSTAGEGAIAVMAYAMMFAFLPVEVFAHAVTSVFYPSLSRHFSMGRVDEAGTVFHQALRFILLLTLPAGVMLYFFAEPLVVVLLERGAFTAADSRQVAGLIAVLALAMVCRAGASLAFRVMHAALRPWWQIAIGLGGVVLHTGLCMVLVGPLGAMGVALATSVSALAIFVVGTSAALGLTGGLPRAGLWVALARIAVIALFVGVLARALPGLSQFAATMDRQAAAAVALGIGGLVFAAGAALAWLIGQEDIRRTVRGLGQEPSLPIK